MGVNVFGLKLLAFAVGAFLAGLAGTIKAHHDTSVSPDQYVFLESAFLLAAVVLGGMGTVTGVLVGATILKLLPEKLREVNDYRLLMFGLLLVVMMRFRPGGPGAEQAPAAGVPRRGRPSSPSSSRPSTSRRRNDRHRDPGRRAADVAPAGPRGQRRDDAVRRPHRRRQRRA